MNAYYVGLHYAVGPKIDEFVQVFVKVTNFVFIISVLSIYFSTFLNILNSLIIILQYGDTKLLQSKTNYMFKRCYEEVSIIYQTSRIAYQHLPDLFHVFLVTSLLGRGYRIHKDTSIIN